jgi:arginase
MLVLPWHIFDALIDGLNITLPHDAQLIDSAPAGEGEPWRRLAQLYEPVSAAVAAATTPQIVLSGDCITPLAVLAGVQRRHVDPALVWFDAHGDFHTEQSTTSGYLGGLPLAKAVGRGDMTLPSALGLRPLAEERVLLVDARDLDPGEVTALATSSVRRSTVQGAADALPEGPLHLHIDVDVLDAALLPGLRFPVGDGPDIPALSTAVREIVRTRELVGLSIAATWRPADSDRTRNDACFRAILEAAHGAVS